MSEANQDNRAPVDRVVIEQYAQRTPWEIAQLWYSVDDIERAIKDSGSGEFGAWREIPRNVTSREFAEWLTEQYRLAMAKGVQLGRLPR